MAADFAKARSPEPPAAQAAAGRRRRTALWTMAAAAVAAVAWQASTLVSPLPADAQAQSSSAADIAGSPFEPDREAFRAEVRAYLLDNPEVLVEALQAFEARQQALADAQARAQIAGALEEIEQDGFSFVAGNPEGDVTVVEFLDYNCGFCKRAHGEVKALLDGDPNIRYVIKEFPILGPSSVFAGRAALAALAIDDGAHYLDFHNSMMEHTGQLTEADVQGYAEAVGLDWSAVQAGMEEPEVDQRLSSTYDLAARIGVNGTPAFVIGGEFIGGFAPAARLAEVVEDVRSASQ